MRIICSYCRRDMGVKPPLEVDDVTHSICQPCVGHYRLEWQGLRLGEYLDSFELPVLVVDPEARVLAANQLMADALHQSDRELFGLLGGEVLECVRARRSEGCGRTVHCATCPVRSAVTHTAETGEPCERVPAYLERADGRQSLVISTELLEGAVLVRLHSLELDGEH